MLGQKRQQSQGVLFARFKTQKHNRNHEKLFNFRNLVLLKGFTFYLKDKEKRYKDFKNISNVYRQMLYYEA